MKRSLRGFGVFVTLLAVAACDSGTDLDSLNLSGTWTGDLTFSTDGGEFSGPATVTVTQTGTSLSGTMTLGDGEASSVSGSLSGTTLAITMTPAQSAGDDCHLYSVMIGFSATQSMLTAASGSGQACDGDGMGGHSALHTVTGVSGSLAKS